MRTTSSGAARHLPLKGKAMLPRGLWKCGLLSFPLQGKVAFGENACVFYRKTEEVVLLWDSEQISDTAGGTTSSDPAYGRPTFP